MFRWQRFSGRPLGSILPTYSLPSTCSSSSTGSSFRMVAAGKGKSDVWSEGESVVGELKELLLTQQKKVAGGKQQAAQSADRFPPMSLSQLMLEIPGAMKAELRQNGGLVKTLRRHPGSFYVTENGLEVGVTGITLGERVTAKPSASNTSTVAGTTVNTDALGGEGEHGYVRPKTIGQNMKAVVVGKKAKIPQPVSSVVARIEDGGRTFVCAFGSIDLTVPPLSQVELERAKKLRYLIDLDPAEDAEAVGVEQKQGGERGTASSDEGFLYSMDKIHPDSYYKERGYYTPHEVADMYAPYCPTFPVEVKMLMRQLPPHLKDPVMNPRGHRFFKPQDYMKRYPSVFTIKGGKYRTTTVQLAGDLKHPSRGKADRYMQKFRLDRAPKSRDELRDEEISNLLERHLRGKAQPDESAPFVRLVDFINAFPPEDVECLNQDPPERVIAVIQRAPHLFQLRGAGGEHEYYNAEQSTDTGTLSDSPAEKETEKRETPSDVLGVSDYFIRLRPPSLAPLCMSNYSEENTPHRELLEAINAVVTKFGGGYDESKSGSTLQARAAALQKASALYTAPQPTRGKPMSVPRKPASVAVGGIPPAPTAPLSSPKPAVAEQESLGTLSLRRWVPLDRIYEALPMNLRRELKPFRGLASFLRLHGRSFHVSIDKSHVIAHNPQEPPPLLSTTQEGDKVTLQMKGVNPTGQVPTTRAELMGIDPNNALLDHKTLCEEIHRILPDHPVTLTKLMKKLPPLMKAAVPSKPQRMFSSSPLFSTWMPSPGNLMLQKAELGPPPKGYGVKEAAGVEEVLEIIRQHIPPGGIPFVTLRNRIPPAARNTVRHIGGIDRFIASYPQYFVIDETVPHRAIVHLAEHFEGAEYDQ